MRPSSIITFERLFFISLALGLVGYFVNYDAAMAQLQADPNTAGMEMGGGFMLGAYLFGVAINLESPSNMPIQAHQEPTSGLILNTI